jgi:hypothetical protein
MNFTVPKAALDKLTDVLGAIGLDTNGPGWGPATIQRLREFADAAEAGEVQVQVTDDTLHHVLASSFADPADITAFKEAKARGLSDEQAFKYGDNGIGYWGTSTAEGTGPQCALPPEQWEHLEHPHGTAVEITLNGNTVVALLGDTMPREADIKNHAGIDLSPDACAALGVDPGNMWSATWRWA